MIEIIDKQIRPQITLVRHLSEPDPTNHSLHVVVDAPKSNALAKPLEANAIQPLQGPISGIQVQLTVVYGSHIKELSITTPVTFAFKLNQLPLEDGDFVEVVINEEKVNGEKKSLGKGVVRHEEADLDDDADNATVAQGSH